MTIASVSIGSNIDRERNIGRAIDALRELYSDLAISRVYQTEAVGFEGEDFLNLAVCFDTAEPVRAVWNSLKVIEDEIGRDRSQPRFSARTIDLDLLTYGDLIVDENGLQLPRDEILHNAFVLKPLSDILGEQIHPQRGRTYLQLWREMETHADRIEVFELDLS